MTALAKPIPAVTRTALVESKRLETHTTYRLAVREVDRAIVLTQEEIRRAEGQPHGSRKTVSRMEISRSFPPAPAGDALPRLRRLARSLRIVRAELVTLRTHVDSLADRASISIEGGHHG